MAISPNSLLMWFQVRVGHRESCGIWHPFLSVEKCCKAGTTGICGHCHWAAAGQEQLLGPQHLHLPSNPCGFWESWARARDSFVVNSVDLPHKWLKSLGLEAVNDKVTFQFFLAGSNLPLIAMTSRLSRFPECWCWGSALDIQDCIRASGNSLFSVTRIGSFCLIEP